MTLVVLCVVPDGHGRYLIVEERDGTFYLPAGRVHKDENLMAAAVRETLEEAGILIGLQGILGLDHEPKRMRFCFVGYPATNMAPKSTPDDESRGACWLTKDELRQRPLRHPEVLEWIEKYERSAALLPCAAYTPLGIVGGDPENGPLRPFGALYHG